MTSKIVYNGSGVNGEERNDLEAMGNGQPFTWASFQAALDAYRDAAYWAGYKDAKDELLRHYLTGETDIDFRKYGIKK